MSVISTCCWFVKSRTTPGFTMPCLSARWEWILIFGADLQNFPFMSFLCFQKPNSCARKLWNECRWKSGFVFVFVFLKYNENMGLQNLLIITERETFFLWEKIVRAKRTDEKKKEMGFQTKWCKLVFSSFCCKPANRWSLPAKSQLNRQLYSSKPN